jgi:hypothetical protein
VLVVLNARKIIANFFMLIWEIYHETDASIVSFSSTEEQTVMWHQKLGHVLEKSLKILSNRSYSLVSQRFLYLFISIVLQVNSISWSLAHQQLRVNVFYTRFILMFGKHQLYPWDEQDTLYHS